MKITKFVHSCLLVEMPDPINRTVLFDPGSMSEAALAVDKLIYLDDIFITHKHGDHMSIELIKKLVAKFPDVRITAPDDAVAELAQAGIPATSQAPEGVTYFEAPHEDTGLLAERPKELGYHYLGLLTNPGDSHSFTETKTVLALPVQAPWGSTVNALNLALRLRPQHILPVHDWHWSDAAREQTYARLEAIFAKEGITFHKLKTAEPVVIPIEAEV